MAVRHGSVLVTVERVQAIASSQRVLPVRAKHPHFNMKLT